MVGSHIAPYGIEYLYSLAIGIDNEQSAVFNHNLRLRRAGLTLILITDGSTRHQRSKIRALDIEKYFDDILISEETGGDKTTEVPWTIVERKYGRPGQRFVYIGDNMSKDFKIPGMRGWHTVMMLDTEGVNVFPQNILSMPAINRPKTVFTDFLSL